MRKEKKYISYTRVSTTRQELGIESQISRIHDHINNHGGLIIDILVEIESGRNNDRKILNNAIKLCQEKEYILLFTEIDRLSRDVNFLIFLFKKIKLECIDIPKLDIEKLTFFGSIAQREGELISSRTKRALSELKKKGVILGSPQNFTQKGRDLGLQVVKENKLKNEDWNKAKTFIDHYYLKNGKMNFSKVAVELNNNGYKTRYGNLFTPTTVKRLISY